MKDTKSIFERHFGYPVGSKKLLCGAGSPRKYSRLADTDGMRSAILTESGNVEENRTFIGMSRFFRSAGVNVPEVYEVAEDYASYLQEDLGDRSLLDIINEGNAALTESLLRKTIDQLVALQTAGIDHLENSASEEGFLLPPAFGRRLALWDLNYFKYEFLKPSGIDFDESMLEDEFERLCERLLAYPSEIEVFMMRDCQSRNVMVTSVDEAYLIDFQGGRRGPAIYDVISLLWQAKASLSDDIRMRMLDYFAEKLSDRVGIEASKVKADYKIWVLFRLLQVLGAYGLRGLVERKSHFIESIPAALKSVNELLSGSVGEEFPALRKVLSDVVSSPRFATIGEKSDRLTVKVFSFSYKKGYPEDLTGNGGGFMFDCRAMHNPGRYEEYKQKTGRDREVCEFLEERGEVQEFIANAEGLVMPAVERYLKRGFSSLQIGFGCTGGQHRSVYCAEHVAHDIASRFPDARVELIHREQGITEIYND